MKATICKTYSFSAAHLLPNHDGKCARLHGHNYKVGVQVHGKVKGLTGESDEGMVMDFAEMDEKVKPLIDEMDHYYIACGDEDDPIPAAHTTTISVRTTAENIAGELLKRLVEFWPRKLYWVAVRVWETDKAWAEVTTEDL